ncbi:ATP-binding protein [Streptomyces roseolus]|uniref:ATP-binding protein n=1 Tax=Streptomyces roseolus TaxID=67358 RepID=UPI0036550FDB
MPTPHLPPQRPVPLGRSHEAQVIDRLLHQARAGRGETLVIRGEAGIGKTTLLDYARTAPGMGTLRVSGAEFESELAFAALHQLCAPMLSVLRRLPDPQRGALESAFGLSTGTPDRFHLGLAVLNLLSEAAARQPLLCLVDDAQWLDRASARVLAFVARRIQDEPITVVFAVREPASGDDLAGLPELRLGGLTDAHARGLLDSRLRAPLDPQVRERIVAEAGGNPLALLELPQTADLAGGFALPATAPAPGSVEASYRTRLEALPAPTRLLMLTAAAEPLGEPSLLHRAARLLDVDPEAATPAEDAGLLTVSPWVRFRHPLVRSAVYRTALPEDRRAVHRALAEVTDDDQPDRRAWHRSMAAAGPDEDVAASLERSAGRARARGGIAATAAFLERAATLTPDPDRRATRALAAARAKRDTGAADAALELVAMAETDLRADDTPRRAEAAALRARVSFDRKRDDEAVTKLLKAAEVTAHSDPSAARELVLDAFAAAVFVGRFAHGARLLDAAGAARALPPLDRPARPLDLLLDGLATQVSEGCAPAAPLLRQAIDAYRRTGNGDEYGLGEVWMACNAAMDLWDDAAWRTLADRQIALARRRGALADLPVLLSFRALAHIHAGEFSHAAALVDETHTIAVDAGAPPVVYVDVSLAAWRGDETATAAFADVATRASHERGEGRLANVTEYARAVLYNGLGQYESAVQASRPACDLDEPGFNSWVPVEFVEAAVRAGRRDLAVPVLERLSERTAASGTHWATGVELRSRALLTDGPAADELYREAIVQLARSEGTGHLARARLLHGEWLRRAERLTEARAQLRAAHEELTAIGAGAFAARAARELEASGERVSARGIGTPHPLTPQEFQIARLVATGATSREVATQLFLSPRTIDAHLRNVFRKLGITSRRQLRDLPLAVGRAD